MKKLFPRRFIRRFEQQYLIKDRNLTGIIDFETPLKKVAGGLQFTEGPVWEPQQELLFFSDIPGDTIYSISGTDQTCRPYRSPSNHSNGLTLDKKSRLIVCEHGTRQVTRTEKNGVITVLCSHYRGKRLNSPNDVIVKSDGSIYFTDPSYGITNDMQEQPVQGVYRYVPDEDSLTLIIADIKTPNGLAFTPDESLLYVDSSHPQEQVLFVFEVLPSGLVGKKERFFDFNTGAKGSPDGMKIDSSGNIYCTGPGGLWIFNQGGAHLGTIKLPEIPSNCAWGDTDRRTLFITAMSSVYSLRTKIEGLAAGGNKNYRGIQRKGQK
ncbi:MAG: SMP-30/gluconolactonase/LRE family protein [Candidatus Neomarinimicrobiota bacterium]